MRAGSDSDIRAPISKGTALLWDESFLWGIMAYNALSSAGLDFDLIRASQIKAGCLEGYKAIFVPGGWASNKLKALGEEGARAIRDFVRDGGTYIGLCGGAGLATLDGIGLVPVRRMATKDRVPSFSGRMRIGVNSHILWEGVSDPVFHVWWPSQFLIEDKGVNVIALYLEAMPDSFSSDLNITDAESVSGWTELEQIYGINLDPKRMMGEPAAIECGYGKGRVLLSLLHFDTPGDANGALVLNNLKRYINGGDETPDSGGISGIETMPVYGLDATDPDIQKTISEMVTVAYDIIELGERNFLWFWRNPMLLQWRRGVRGLEYCTLYIMLKEAADLLKKGRFGPESGLSERLNSIKRLLLPFARKAKRLLLLERFAMQKGHITYERCDDPEIQALRNELFSGSKSYSGLFKNIIDRIDEIVFLGLCRTGNKRRK